MANIEEKTEKTVKVDNNAAKENASAKDKTTVKASSTAKAKKATVKTENTDKPNNAAKADIVKEKSPAKAKTAVKTESTDKPKSAAKANADKEKVPTKAKTAVKADTSDKPKSATNKKAPAKTKTTVKTETGDSINKEIPTKEILEENVVVVSEDIKDEVTAIDNEKAKNDAFDKLNDKIVKLVDKLIKDKENKKKDKIYAKSVLFVASEAGPFIRSGGLGDVAGALPRALNDLNVDARVILPLYYDIPDSFRSTMKYLGSVYVALSWRYLYCGLFSYVFNGVTYYFIDNEYYFKRNGIYGHYDDAERFAFFSKAVLECLRLVDFIPDVIHSNDWHTALVPVFLDAFYRGIPEYQNIKSVFTIHNIEFQGKYGKEINQDILGLPDSFKSIIEYGTCINFMKGAIECCNAVTTVSPSYANEIMDRYYSYGLDAILKTRSFKLKGIINGIDTKLYSPANDVALFKNYTYETIENKYENKLGLLKMFDMECRETTPLIGMVTRLTEQKGMDLLIARLDSILANNDVQMIILGKGDWKYENILQEYQYKYPNKLKVIINFSTDIANKIYAGSDLFLMPSKFEPCGLSQLIAMNYGTIPIVRRTGGLNDTVQGFSPVDLSGNGFTFYSYNADDMYDAISRAIGTFHCKREWNALIANAMYGDFSWENSAKQYLDLYNSIS